MQPIIGTTVVDRKVHKVPLDPAALLMGHLLTVASSGGGKSWAVRVLLEQTFGLFPHLVIDREGELKTLREKFDYIIFSADSEGDCRIDHRSGGLLARRMLELNASCIVDVFEFSDDQRGIFVRDFCKALINAPRALWGPRLVIIDEAHEFAPETGKAESKQAVCELLAKGRKRGCGTILASQRLAKLSKDAISECRNKMYGFCNLLADRKRATDDLGFLSKKDQELFRQLDTGTFYAVGPAISKKEVILIKTAKVQTTHPRPGEGIQAHTPPAKTKVQRLIKELSDLPSEAKQEIVDLQNAKAEITKLRSELTRARNESVVEVDTRTLQAAKNEGYEEGHRHATEEVDDKIREIAGVVDDLLKPNILSHISYIEDAAKNHQKVMLNVLQALNDHLNVKKLFGTRTGRWKTSKANKANPPRPAPAALEPQEVAKVAEGLTAAGQKILDSAAWWRSSGVHEPTKAQVAFAAGYKVAGHFNNTLSSLRSAHLVDYPTQGRVGITDAGLELANNASAPLTNEELHNRCRGLLNSAKVRIFDVMLEAWPEALTKEELADRSGYNVGGHFNNTVSSMRTAGFLEYPSRGQVKASDILFAVEGR